MAGGVCGRRHAYQGACMAGRAWIAGETTIEAGGTHPTGMHSCFFLIKSAHMEISQNGRENE